MASTALSTFRSPPLLLPDGEGLGVLEVFRCIFMLFCYCGLWLIRLFLNQFRFYPTLPASRSLHHLSRSCNPLRSKHIEELDHQNRFTFSNSAVGRALSQVLCLLADIPVSSEKYEFTQNLADKLILENITEGDLRTWEVNRIALGASFARTSKLLTITLEGLQQQEEIEAYRWPWKLFCTFFLKGPSVQLPYLCLENFFSRLMNVFSPVQQSDKILLLPSKSRPNPQSGTDCMAEKLARQLLWIAHKLRDCAAVEEAILQWSNASHLATYSLSAHPRVQCSILQLCVFLFKELASTELAVSRGLKLRSLLLWIPLLCCAKTGYDAPLLTPSQKAELVVVLEKIVMSLPDSDQEIVLAVWLEEYALSFSDWPNLQQCYDRWCHISRKLDSRNSVPKLIC